METNFYSLLIFMDILTEKVLFFLVPNILLCLNSIQNVDCCLNCMQVDQMFSDIIHVNLDYLLGNKQHLEDILTIEI
jgi:hypothetical protein